MELKVEQLEQTLQKKILPVYLLASDEFLLLEESCQLVKYYAKQQGFQETERLIVEKGFRWSDLNNASASLSLFGEKKVIDLRIPNGKPGTEGSEAIINYLENASPDNLLLIRCPQLNKQSLNTKWIKVIKQHGAVSVIWKVKPAQLPAWIQQRVRGHQLNIDREAAQILAERVEGNLLAASQEAEKLSLLFPADSQIRAKQIIQTVANNSRYDVFSLIEHALAAEAQKALMVLRGLREERTELTIIAWALRSEIQTLLKIEEGSQQHKLSEVYKSLRIWSNKQGLYTRALKRLQRKQLNQYLIDLAELDKTIKGRPSVNQNSSADDLCEALLLGIAGKNLHKVKLS